MVYEMCRKFADEELAPNAGKWDQKHEFPTEAVDKLVSRYSCGLLYKLIINMHYLSSPLIIMMYSCCLSNIKRLS